MSSLVTSVVTLEFNGKSLTFLKAQHAPACDSYTNYISDLLSNEASHKLGCVSNYMMDCLTSHHGALLKMCHVFNCSLTEVLLERNVERAAIS